MSYADFTRLYGTTARAKFWCDYMAGLKVGGDWPNGPIGKIYGQNLSGHKSACAGPAARPGHAPVPARALRLVQGRHQRGAALRRPLRGVLQVARWGNNINIHSTFKNLKTAQSATRRGRTLSWLAGTQTPRWCSCPTVLSTPRYTAPPSPGLPGYPSN